MRTDAACCSMGFLCFICTRTTYITVSHDLMFPCIAWNTSQTLVSSPAVSELLGSQKQHMPWPILSHVVLTGSLGDVSAWPAGRSNKTVNYCSHPEALPSVRTITGVSFLYPGSDFLCFIGMLYFWCLSHFVKCDWKRPVDSENVGKEKLQRELTTYAAWLAAKIHVLRKLLPKHIGFVHTTFPRERMQGKKPHAG